MADFSFFTFLNVILVYIGYFYGIYVGKKEVLKTTKYSVQKVKTQLDDANKLISYIEEYNEDVGFKHHIENYKKKWNKL